MSKLLLVGGGGHCRACIDVIELDARFSIAGVVQPATRAAEPLEYPVLGDDDDLQTLFASIPNALVTVGQIKSASKRIQLYDLVKRLGFVCPKIISPFAYVSPRAMVDEGTIVMHGAIINVNARIGHNCIINSQALVEHDSIVESHCHLSTGARINGGVTIKSGTFIGSGAILREGICVGENVVIGAGQTVMRDVPDNTLLRTT